MSISDSEEVDSSDDDHHPSQWLAGASTLEQATTRAQGLLDLISPGSHGGSDLLSLLDTLPGCIRSTMHSVADLNEETEGDEEELDELRATRTMLEVELLELEHRLSQRAAGEIDAAKSDLQIATAELKALQDAQAAAREQASSLSAEKKALAVQNQGLMERMCADIKGVCQRSVSYRLIRVLIPESSSVIPPQGKTEVFGKSIMCRYAFKQPRPDQELFDTISLDNLGVKAEAQAAQIARTIGAVDDAVARGCVSWRAPEFKNFTQRMGMNPWTKVRQLEPLMVTCERVVPSNNGASEPKTETQTMPAEELVAHAQGEVEEIEACLAACDQSTSYHCPMYFTREHDKPLRCTYSRRQGRARKDKWFRVDVQVLTKWAQEQAGEIKAVLELLQHPRVKEQCRFYTVPTALPDFFQPMGEELQFWFGYTGGAELESPYLSPTSVGVKAFLSWGLGVKGTTHTYVAES